MSGRVARLVYGWRVREMSVQERRTLPETKTNQAGRDGTKDTEHLENQRRLQSRTCSQCIRGMENNEGVAGGRSLTTA